MALEMKQSQQLRQGLRMTPQLLQAIRLRLLQLSRTELHAVIEEQMVENPLLERDVERVETPDADMWGDQDRAATAEAGEARDAIREIDWERYLENYSSPLPGGGGSGGQDADLPGIDQTLSRARTLAEDLSEQVTLVEAEPLHRQIAEVIIGNLDENGYLRSPSIDELAASLGVPYEDVEEALLLVQELEPTGVAARDLRECLLLQVQALPDAPRGLEALIRDHLPDLERQRYPVIARALGLPREEVLDLHRFLRTLEPRPGRAFAPDETTYIQPDIYIHKRDGEWVASLNDDGMPKLRVSRAYRDAIRRKSEPEARKYVQERLKSASWLIQSIEQRQQTILKVTRSIIRFQEDFLEHGIKALRPLVLREVADDIGMHESTVSRVTTSKYVHTPRGIFELKFFFNSTIRKDGGDDMAGAAVRKLIEEIIADEPAKRPWSDQKLVEILQEEHDIEIARRTVAKYREAMGIPSSSRRKRYL